MMAEAEALLVSSGLGNTDEIITICAESLGFFAREADAYCKAICYSKRFLPHFIEQLTGLVRFLESPATADTEGFSLFGEVQARAFSLVEDMALFTREKVLQNGAVAEHPFEKKLLSYFESCGNWAAGSNEEVTDTYYNRLPISVMQRMTASPAATLA